MFILICLRIQEVKQFACQVEDLLVQYKASQAAMMGNQEPQDEILRLERDYDPLWVQLRDQHHFV